jgi:hypothetical protein
MAITLHGKLHSSGYTCRNLDIYDLVSQYHTLTVTIRATGLDLLACPLAVRANGFSLHTPKEAVDNLYDATSSMTLSTCLKLRSVLGARTMAMRTLDVFLDFEMFFDTSNNISQADLDTNTN